MSQTIRDTIVQETLEARMRDGTVLRADVWRPSGGGKHPVLLMRLPYDKAQGEDLCYAHPSWYARRGYAVVVQDVRGRWASDGEFTPFEHEPDDGEDTMSWLGSLPFSNGRIGMYGFSYPGHTQLQIAVRRPEGLRCMVPGMTSPDLYEGWAYNNGAFALAFNASWATFLADDVTRRRDPDLEPALAAMYAKVNDYYWWLPLSEIPNLTPRSAGGFFSDWLAHETRDGYWTRWDVTDRLPEVEVPALTVGGLYDVFLEGTVASYHGIRRGPRSADTRLVIGPWYHMPWLPAFGDVDFGPEARNLVDQLQLAFFDQWLRDGDPATGSGPSCRAPTAGRASPTGPRPRSPGRSTSGPEPGPTRSAATATSPLRRPAPPRTRTPTPTTRPRRSRAGAAAPAASTSWPRWARWTSGLSSP